MILEVRALASESGSTILYSSIWKLLPMGKVELVALIVLRIIVQPARLASRPGQRKQGKGRNHICQRQRRAHMQQQHHRVLRGWRLTKRLNQSSKISRYVNYRSNNRMTKYIPSHPSIHDQLFYSGLSEAAELLPRSCDFATHHPKNTQCTHSREEATPQAARK